MAAAKQARAKPSPKPKKTPQQLAQWAAYEALCAQREEEAKARKEVADAQAAKAKVADDKLKAIESLRLNASMFHEAEQLRQLAQAVFSQLDPGAPAEVLEKAVRWRREVLGLAAGIDPTAEILASFASPKQRDL
ncbi:hypothetical protein [Acidovorax sp.]|uniref:hypothetical protein n=1 Tax=Acidovorax sp. TaxID=1872122 RepID=UPI002ACEC30F|nr:hypothetical protein [Acidovorax sp.]MDZ7863369.1 hypothetical protein [Acidovorax sp.]